MSAAIPPGQRVYAIGDIHGRYDLLEALHGAISEDASKAPDLHKTIIYLGDYVDRGSQVYEVVEMLANGFPPGLQKIFLRGNHEDMMLGFLAKTFPFGAWLANGANATLEGYDVHISTFTEPKALAFGEIGVNDDEVADIRAALADKLPTKHRRFLEGALKPYHRCGDYIFVHAGVKPDVPFEQQHPYDLIWIREEFLDSTSDHGGVIVHGHSVFDDVDINPNRIGVDTGAWRSNCLSCLVIEHDELRIIQT